MKRLVVFTERQSIHGVAENIHGKAENIHGKVESIHEKTGSIHGKTEYSWKSRDMEKLENIHGMAAWNVDSMDC